LYLSWLPREYLSHCVSVSITCCSSGLIDAMMLLLYSDYLALTYVDASPANQAICHNLSLNSD